MKVHSGDVRCAWFPVEGPPAHGLRARRLTMYLATLDCATSNPSCAVPRGYAVRPKTDSPCSSAGSTRAASFRSAVALPMGATSNANSRESRPCANARASRAGWDCENLHGDRRKPAPQLDKEPAIMVREPDTTRQPTPQDIQLMSKHRVLSFKPQLRLEWRSQDGQNETEQPDHSTSLGDSITSSTQIRFSVHTMGRRWRRFWEQMKSGG